MGRLCIPVPVPDYGSNWPGAAPEGNGRSLSSESSRDQLALTLIPAAVMINLVSSHFVPEEQQE